MSLTKFSELNPNSRSQVERARAAAQSKNYDYAVTLMTNVLRDDPLYLEGRRFLRAVEISKFKAMGSFTRQMASMRGSTGNMMKLASGKKTPQEQLIAAEEFLVTDPYNQKANMMVADAGAALGYPDFKCFAFETLADGKSDAKPGDKSIVPILHNLAQAYMETKNAGKAEKTFERLLTIDPRDGDALSGLKNASAAKSHEKWESAESKGDFREALKDTKESELLEQQSKIVKSSDAIQEQIDRLYEKHVADPASPVHSKAIAKLYEQRNDFAYAIPYYEHSYEQGGRTDSSLEKTIGDLRVRANEVELQQLRDEHSQQADPEIQTQLQTAIDQKEAEHNQARLALAEARVKAQPNEGEFRYDLGEALFRTGQYKRATEELQQSLKQPSVRYQALNLMGQSFMKRNMLDFAIKQLSLAESELLGMDEMKKQIVYNLGLAYEVIHQPEKALDQWKKIYEHDMSYRDVAPRVEASYGGSNGT